MFISPRPSGGYSVSVPNASKALDLADASAKLATSVLKAKSRSSRDWAHRFVVVRPAAVLAYYESDADAADRPKGLILLDDAAAVDVTEDSDGKGASWHVIVVRPSPAVADARPLLFRVESASEAREWVRALLSCRVSAAAALVDDADRRLAVSRAETAALHDTLQSYKELVTDHDAAVDALGIQIDSAAARASAERTAVEAAAELLSRTLAESDTAVDVARVSLQAGIIESDAAVDAARAFLRGECVQAVGASVVSRAAAAAAAATGAGNAVAVGTAARAARTSANVDAEKILTGVANSEPSFARLRNEVTKVSQTCAAFRALVVAIADEYRTLRSRAGDLLRIVSRLQARAVARAHASAAEEAAWTEKEAKWAAAVQALSIRLAREKERTASLAELLRAERRERDGGGGGGGRGGGRGGGGAAPPRV